MRVGVEIKESPIHGLGVFVTKPVKKGENIGVAIDAFKRVTYVGSKVNHSWNPSCVLVKNENSYHIVTAKDLSEYSEVTLDYRDTPEFIAKPEESWK